jgi:hypothetical protein
MGLTFATPNGGNSAMTGNRNSNNNAKASAKTSNYSRVGSGHPSATTSTPKAKTEEKKDTSKVTQGSPHERNTEANVTRAIGEILSSAVSTGLLGNANNNPVAEIPAFDTQGVDQGLLDALKNQGLLGSGQESINKGIGGLGLQLGDATLGLGNQLGDVQLGLGNQIGGLGDQFNTGLGDLNTGLGKGQENIGLQVESLGDRFNTYGQENVDKLNGIEDLISGLQTNSSESDSELASSISGVVGKFKTDVEGLVGGIGDSITGIGDSMSNMDDFIKGQIDYNVRGGMLGELIWG